MKLIIIDLETYYSTEYSLSKMTTEEYVRDPRFYCQMVGVQAADEAQAKVYPGHDLKYNTGLRALIQENIVGCHNAAFDLFILNEHFDLRPKAIVDTLSMGRMLLPHNKRHSLAFLSKQFGLPEKMTQRLADVKGIRNLNQQQFAALAEYCAGDVENTMQLAKVMIPMMPPEELKLIDMTIRMFTEPKAVLDGPLLKETWLHEIERKKTQLERIQEATGATVADLQSSAKFAKLLEAQGVEPPTKPSPSNTEKQIFAFSKTDDALKELLEAEAGTLVGDLIEARLGAKSTLMETRAKRMLEVSERGAFPFPLSYYGAFTSRWAATGGEAANVQNFTRGSNLRKAICAPKGFVIGVGDASQIEARMLCHEAGQWDKVEAFATGRDLYSESASKFYRFAVNKHDNPCERGLGKLQILSCGYGAGGESIRTTAKRGTYGPPIILSAAEGVAVRDAYREDNQAVVAMWRQGEKVLRDLLQGKSEYQWGNSFLVKGQRIYAPNGMFMDYSTIQFEDGAYSMGTKKGVRHLYGAKLVQNAIQFIARLVASQAAIRVAQAGIILLSTTHDELITMLPESEADSQQAFVLQQLKQTPKWCDARLGLDAEGGFAREYSK